MKKSKSSRALATVVAAAVASSVLIVGAPSGAAAARKEISVKGTGFDYRKLKPKLSPVKFKDDEIVRKKFKVPMSAGEPTHPGLEVELHVEVVRPKKVKPYATILELSPYHGTIANRSGTRILPGPKRMNVPDYVDSTDYNSNSKAIGLAGYFAPRGYAVVFANLRGTGKSTGCLDHLGPRDQSDSKDLIKWIAKQKWSNGRVGMTGHSYVGSTPQMAAAQDPKALKTIVPSAGLAAMYHHKFQHGVPYFAQWVGPAAAYELLSIQRHLAPFLGPEYGDSFGDGMEWFACGLPNSAIISGDDYDAGAYDDEEPFRWDAERDSRKGATKSDIPVFAVHGVNDNAARIPALDWFDKRRKKQDKAWIGQWDHGSGLHPNDRTCAEGSVSPCQNDQWTLALHAWFDKHLKKRAIYTGPRIELFLNNKTVFQPRTWPTRPRSRWRRFWFRQDGKLVRKRPTKEATDSYVASPDGEFDEYSSDGEFGTNALAWTSAPMKKSILLAGIPTARIFEAQTVSRMHIIVTLYDIAPNGDVVCVVVNPKTSGSQRCGISKASYAMNPELRRGIKNPAPVTPGRKMRLRMRGMAHAYVLKKGHKLRAVIASSQPDKVATHAEGTVTVHMGGSNRRHASHLALPIFFDARLRKDGYHN